jgi:hypothetical protein
MSKDGVILVSGGGGGGGSAGQLLITNCSSSSSGVVNGGDTRHTLLGQTTSTAIWTSAEANTLYTVPYAGTIDRLAVVTNTAQPATNSIAVTVRKNNGDTTLTLTIPVSAAAGLFTDNSNSFAVAAGDKISIKAVNPGPNGSANFTHISVRYTPTIP